MFDIFNLKDAREKPLLAAEFIKIVPAYELIKHLLNSSTEATEDGLDPLLIDLEHIRDAILESGRDDLQLVLATYGKIIELWDTEVLEKLAAKGPAYKEALFSNSRINWYRLDLRKDEEGNLLRTALLANIDDKANKSLIYTIARNPRMDRSVIANAMRGTKGFEELPMGTRLLIGAEAILVEEIPAQFYAGKDSPDSHEIYFSSVNDVFISMVRDAKEVLDEKTFNQYLTGLILWKLPRAKLGLKAPDWLTAEEIETLEEKVSASEKFMDSYNRKQHASLQKVFDYFGNWYDRDDGYPQTTALIARAGVAIMAMNSLLRSYTFSHTVEKIVEEMLDSPHLLVRAAGYATIFNNIEVESNSPSVKSFFASYPENTLEKWMGITNTQAFWLCDGYDSLWSTIKEEMAGSGYQVKIESAHDDMYQYLFYSGSYAERLEEHNKTTRPSLFKPKSLASRVMHTAFSVDESKIKAAQESKGLLGKLFK